MLHSIRLLIVALAAMFLSGCGRSQNAAATGGNGQNASSSQAQTAQSVNSPSSNPPSRAAAHGTDFPASDGFKNGLADAAQSPPSGSNDPPQIAAGQRFPSQLTDVLHAASLAFLSDRSQGVRVAPADALEKLRRSSDPLLRSFAYIEKRLTDEETATEQLEKQAQGVRDGLFLSQPDTHTETNWVPTGNGYYSRESKEVRNDYQPEIDALKSKGSDIYASKDLVDTDLRWRIHDLAKYVTAIGEKFGAPGAPSGAISFDFNLDPQQEGNVVLVNKSGRTLHHCLVLFQGEELPHDNNAPDNAASGIYYMPIDQDYPSVVFAYFDQMVPDYKVISSGCYSGQYSRIRRTTASLWSDELSVENLEVTNGNAALAKLNQAVDEAAKKEQAQVDKNNADLARAQADQLASLRVKTENGCITYQFTAIGVTTFPVVAPEGVQFFNAVADQGKLWVSLNGNWVYAPITRPCKTGDAIFVSAEGDLPVHATIRFVLSGCPDQLNTRYSPPPWPMTTSEALSPDHQSQYDALVKLIKSSPTLNGTQRFPRSPAQPAQLHLEWKNIAFCASGWSSLRKDGPKKNIEGYIVDTPAYGPTLMLTETSYVDPQFANNGVIRQQYFLRIQTLMPGMVTIRKATWGDPATGKVLDVTAKLRAEVRNNALNIPANRRFGDPTPGVKKTLTVEMVDSDGNVTSAAAHEGTLLKVDHIQTFPPGSLAGIVNTGTLPTTLGEAVFEK